LKARTEDIKIALQFIFTCDIFEENYLRG
jgi:hypothetical protein